MSQEPLSEYQKFINKNASAVFRVLLSCKKRLELNPKLTEEELFNAANKEYSDVYYEDRSNWIAFFKKNVPKILHEIDESLRFKAITTENKSPFHEEIHAAQVAENNPEETQTRKSVFTEAQMQKMLHESAILEKRIPRDARGLEKDDEKEHAFVDENINKTKTDTNSELLGNQDVKGVSAQDHKKQLESEYLRSLQNKMMR